MKIGLVPLWASFAALAVASLATSAYARTGHNSFDPSYRNPPGAVPTGSGTVLIRFGVDSPTASAVMLELSSTLRPRHPRPRQEIAMTLEAGTSAPRFWRAEIPIPASPATLSYFFKVSDGGTTEYYLPQDSDAHTGGWSVSASQPDSSRAYRITVFQSDYHTPDWLKGAVIYQIFPDRFRNGDPSNDPVDGSGWIYGQSAHFRQWNSGVCDPLLPACRGQASTQFFGGDLEGIIDELDGLKSLGVTVLYLNPIFLSPTNHKYDTQDYFTIDPAFGTRSTFDRLVAGARTRGMRVILDGVFNHVSSDSAYFNLYGLFDELGACEAENSPYREWFFLPAIGNPAVDSSGEPILCAPGVSYESFAGVASMPKLNSDDRGVQDLLFARGSLSAGPYWSAEGASGWRLDVGQGPSHAFWRGFRKAVTKLRPDSALIGEIWGDARDWLKGGEWDSVMNYRFRAAVMDWLFDSCAGDGCSGGKSFSDANLSMAPIPESDFQSRLQAIQEDYPAEAWQAMMNLIDSHDTSRVLFLLKKISSDSPDTAKQKLKFLSILQFTYPGAPSVYYGDEVGLAPDDAWNGNTWLVDPYNRAPYPWADQGLSPDPMLQAHYARLGALRAATPALQGGAFHWLQVDDRLRFLSFARGDASAGNDVIVALNRDSRPLAISLNLAAGGGTYVPSEGAKYQDALSGLGYTVHNGRLAIGSIDGLWGRILVRQPSQ